MPLTLSGNFYALLTTVGGCILQAARFASCLHESVDAAGDGGHHVLGVSGKASLRSNDWLGGAACSLCQSPLEGDTSALTGNPLDVVLTLKDSVFKAKELIEECGICNSHFCPLF